MSDTRKMAAVFISVLDSHFHHLESHYYVLFMLTDIAEMSVWKYLMGVEDKQRADQNKELDMH